MHRSTGCLMGRSMDRSIDRSPSSAWKGTANRLREGSPANASTIRSDVSPRERLFNRRPMRRPTTDISFDLFRLAHFFLHNPNRSRLPRPPLAGSIPKLSLHARIFEDGRHRISRKVANQPANVADPCRTHDGPPGGQKEGCVGTWENDGDFVMGKVLVAEVRGIRPMTKSIPRQEERRP